MYTDLSNSLMTRSDQFLRWQIPFVPLTKAFHVLLEMLCLESTVFYSIWSVVRGQWPDSSFSKVMLLVNYFFCAFVCKSSYWGALSGPLSLSLAFLSAFVPKLLTLCTRGLLRLQFFGRQSRKWSNYLRNSLWDSFLRWFDFAFRLNWDFSPWYPTYKSVRMHLQQN